MGNKNKPSSTSMLMGMLGLAATFLTAGAEAQTTISPNYANIGIELRMVNQGEIYFRGSGDLNHGLGWYGTGKLYSSQNIDGPVLYGYNGGALGVNQSTNKKVVLRWNAQGQVIIGNVTAPTPGSYSLYVEKGILTEHIRVAVKTSTQWQDQVFDPNYELMPLSTVEKYIANNHHLPGIPSTAEVMRDGIDLRDMNSRLLQKVEELTLYMLSLKKQVDELQKQASNK